MFGSMSPILKRWWHCQFFVAIVAMHNSIPQKTFYIVVAVYILGLILWGIYELSSALSP